MVFCRQHHDIQVFSKLTKLLNDCTMAIRMSGQWHLFRTSDGALLVNIVTSTSLTYTSENFQDRHIVKFIYCHIKADRNSNECKQNIDGMFTWALCYFSNTVTM